MIHIAGIPIAVGSLHRQLCCWCGHALIDDDLALMMSTDGSGPPKAFAVGALVRVEGNFTAVDRVLSDEVLTFANMPVGWCGQPTNVIAMDRKAPR